MNKMTVRKIKLKEYTNSVINIEELKESIYDYYGYDSDDEDYKNRELRIFCLVNGYSNIYSIVFSINGSPPKGECFFQATIIPPDFNNVIVGNLTFFGNGKVSKTYHDIGICGLSKYINPIHTPDSVVGSREKYFVRCRKGVKKVSDE